MTTLPVMLYFRGRWDSANRYVDNLADGVVINTEATYSSLVSAIASQLSIDTSKIIIEIRYKIDERSPPLLIHNDMGVKVYLEAKKEHRDMSKYPLCISTMESLDLESDSALTPMLCSDFTEDRGIIQSSYMANTFSGISDAIKLVGLGSCEEVDEIEELGSGIICNPNQDVFEKGQVYLNKEVLVNALKRHAILNHFDFKTSRSSSTCYTIQCLEEDCSWSLRASSLNKSQLFTIRDFQSDHTCLLMNSSISERQATKTVVGSLIVGKCVEVESVYRPADIQSDMLRDYGLRLTYMQAWRAKERALELVRGNPAQSYAKLPSYFHILEATYPGSHVRLHKSEDGHFLYAFVALVASIRGWEYCRPIVVVDGTFLSATYKGTMLTANTLDAGGSILPLAYSIVDSENDASWRWFFEQFREAFGQRAEMCVVSDRHPSIIKATSIVYDGVPHFACMWHLLQNVIKNFRKSQDRIIGLFYSMARAYTMLDFNKHMAIVEKIDKRVKDYLLNIGYSKWSRVHAQVNRTWIMTSNIAESVNSRAANAKVLTVLHLLEFMRQLVQKWNNANRSKATFSTFLLGRKYHKILKLNKFASEKLKVRESNEYVYTVLDGITHFTVCLQQRTCSCGRFQLDNLPCPHALAVLATKHSGYEDYCSAYYTRKNWLLTYQFHIEPLPDESTWNIPSYVSEEVVLPPIGKRAPGRPKITRTKTMREDGFKKSKITCSNCGQPGHNRSTCKNVRPYKK